MQVAKALSVSPPLRWEMKKQNAGRKASGKQAFPTEGVDRSNKLGNSLRKKKERNVKLLDLDWLLQNIVHNRTIQSVHVFA